MERDYQLLKDVLSVPTKTYQEDLMVEFLINWLEENGIPFNVDEHKNYDPKQIESGASEYELYFNYMLIYHKDICTIRQLNWTNKPSNYIVNQNENYDFVSICSWIN